MLTSARVYRKSIAIARQSCSEFVGAVSKWQSFERRDCYTRKAELARGRHALELWHSHITKLNFKINLLLIAQPGRQRAYSLNKSLKSNLGISVHNLEDKSWILSSPAGSEYVAV